MLGQNNLVSMNILEWEVIYYKQVCKGWNIILDILGKRGEQQTLVTLTICGPVSLFYQRTKKKLQHIRSVIGENNCRKSRTIITLTTEKTSKNLLMLRNGFWFMSLGIKLRKMKMPRDNSTWKKMKYTWTGLRDIWHCTYFDKI